MTKTENFERIEIASSDELRDWLLKNHDKKESYWLVTYKKVEIDKYVSRDEVLDELISFGWIDGIRRKLDENRTMQLISPRKSQHWAKTYKIRAAKLIAEGIMHESGIKSIELSKSLGLWNFMDDVDNLVIPKDLSDALSKIRGAADFFESINDSSKRFVLRWIKLSKTDATRQKRILKIATLSGKGEKLPGS